MSASQLVGRWKGRVAGQDHHLTFHADGTFDNWYGGGWGKKDRSFGDYETSDDGVLYYFPNKRSWFNKPSIYYWRLSPGGRGLTLVGITGTTSTYARTG
ncbi:hypothetical protein AB0M43_07630 [Longispora sp. NPDC051575]|uniref:hypothetical protein n=1 Tax=Longispora sp. NPDC051575 TaxID=3154943 RepID=UPI003417AD9F